MLDVTGQWIHEQVEKQPWYKANANTVTTAVGFIATLVAWLASQEWAANDQRVQAAVWVVGFVCTIAGVRATPNGWSATQVAQVQAARAQFITDSGCTQEPAPVYRTVVEDPRPADEFTADSLDSLVQQFNAGRG
ncbi:hypothetical protein [Corynebacterium aquilae]|nr:hypothetical protein [Corynebacterium aquilae]